MKAYSTPLIVEVHIEDLIDGVAKDIGVGRQYV